MKKNAGWILIIIFAAIPAVVWTVMYPLRFRFYDLTTTSTSLGQLAGLTGMALYAINLILSARLKIFDRYLNGLNRVYINHHRIGAIAFVLLLCHPILLTTQYLSISLESAASFWLPNADWAVTFGKISLSGMIILLVLTFFISLKYNIWKSTHTHLGLFFFFGGLHVFFITSDVSSNIVLRYYMLSLSALAIVVYVYHTYLRNIVEKPYNYTLTEIKKINNAVVELTLAPLSQQKLLKYKAGQFAFIHFENDDIGKEQHPYSFTSKPSDTIISFVIKNLGDYTRLVDSLSRGTITKIDGPYGLFSYELYHNKNQIWIAGGIGITPFISMARHLAQQSDVILYTIDLYYCVKNESELIQINELNNISSVHKNFRVIPFLSEKQGKINAHIINEMSNSLDRKDIMICGPVPLMKALRSQFKEMGIKRSLVHTEEFKL